MTQVKTNQAVLKEIALAIESIKFGSIEINVHDGKVTQIEKRERVRFFKESNHLTPTASSSGKNE